MYDEFSTDYDRFVNWPARLAVEMPFIEEQLQAVGARRLLDVACGTGMHAIALARRGYEVVGADLSPGMIERAWENGAAAGSQTRFVIAGFGELVEKVGDGFDALLCLGNSLPHALTAEALHTTLADFAAALRPGGLLVIQSRNFDAVLARQARWMTPQAHREGSREWLFIRFYDFDPDSTLTFNVITLQRDGHGAWAQQVETTALHPWLHDELSSAITAVGFNDLAWYGDMNGSPFVPESSGDLIVTARRRAAHSAPGAIGSVDVRS